MTATPATGADRAVSSLPRGARIYVVCVTVAGLGATAHALYTLRQTPGSWEWLVFAALAVLSGSFTIKVPSIPARLSVSETFIFACILLFGPAAATVTMALDGWIISSRRKYELRRVLFNVAEPALSIWAASHLFFVLAGVTPLYGHPVPIAGLVLPLGALTLVYFLLNSGFTALAVAFETGRSPLDLWRDHFCWLSVNYFAGASMSLLLIVAMRQISFSAIGIIVPLLAISYLTLRGSLGRIEDAHRYVARVDRLYVSAVETLAIAIDAKDESTHGHIRRVQFYAMRLARALGITDEATIKAIETAALLHDTGKLAVPEYILNKPGRLTPAELVRMKAHVQIGADILSAIEFPYPVVPIVHAHHESWDGSGYPAGLAGRAIPIGARILAVADCFDALTSDRPYRPRLSEQEALKTLCERRGTMYDPAVVDAFVKLYPEIGLHQPDEPAHRHALVQISRSSAELPEPAAVSRIEATLDERTEEMLALCSLERSLSGQATFIDAASLVATHVRRVVPFSVAAFYVFEPTCDELVARYVAGRGGRRLQGLRIPWGQRLTGWVAANRQAIVNSDAALDLGNLAAVGRPRLRGALAVPLVEGEALMSVLALYASGASAFTDNHARTLHMLAPHIARILRIGLEAETLNRSRDARGRGATAPVCVATDLKTLH